MASLANGQLGSEMAAQPWTPGPGGVEAEQRKTPGIDVSYARSVTPSEKRLA
ncbi:MAG TPA: hypothetical protein VHX36_05800 [Candidatus Acidoferrales bacterium]|jgi:hypothetical protein|nr:hypothetical protein [Candidatus Acidoferrales bacterium]